MSSFATLYAAANIGKTCTETPMKFARMAITAIVALFAIVNLAPVAYADWDPVAEAREEAARKKAAAEAAKRNAEASAKRAEAMRKALAAAPYNEDPAQLARLNEAELRALEKKRQAQIHEAQKAQAARGLDEFAKNMKSLSPEQRAMIERQSGMKIDDLMKQSQQAVKR